MNEKPSQTAPSICCAFQQPFVSSMIRSQSPDLIRTLMETARKPSGTLVPWFFLLCTPPRNQSAIHSLEVISARRATSHERRAYEKGTFEYNSAG